MALYTRSAYLLKCQTYLSRNLKNIQGNTFRRPFLSTSVVVFYLKTKQNRNSQYSWSGHWFIPGDPKSPLVISLAIAVGSSLKVFCLSQTSPTTVQFGESGCPFKLFYI